MIGSRVPKHRSAPRGSQGHMDPLRHEGAQRYVPKGNHFFEVEVQIQRKIRHRKSVGKHCNSPSVPFSQRGRVAMFSLVPYPHPNISPCGGIVAIVHSPSRSRRGHLAIPHSPVAVGLNAEVVGATYKTEPPVLTPVRAPAAVAVWIGSGGRWQIV